MRKPDYFLHPKYLKKARAERERSTLKRGRHQVVNPELYQEELGLTGRVVKVDLKSVFVQLNGEIVLISNLKGEICPVIGDYVVCTRNREEWKISGIKERSNFLARFRGDRQRRSRAGYEQQIIAVNLDLAVIVASVKDPVFHPRFIDRYLVTCQSGNVPAAISLNKADLYNESNTLSLYEELGIPVFKTSTVTGEGIEELKAKLRGTVSVFVGASGVGKSSLINTIFPKAEASQKTVSTKTGEGRHTTTASSLYEWEDDSFFD